MIPERCAVPRCRGPGVYVVTVRDANGPTTQTVCTTHALALHERGALGAFRRLVPCQYPKQHGNRN